MNESIDGFLGRSRSTDIVSGRFLWRRCRAVWYGFFVPVYIGQDEASLSSFRSFRVWNRRKEWRWWCFPAMIFLLEYFFPQLCHLEFESLTVGSERCGVNKLFFQLLYVCLKFDDGFGFWSVYVGIYNWREYWQAVEISRLVWIQMEDDSEMMEWPWLSAVGWQLEAWQENPPS